MFKSETYNEKMLEKKGLENELSLEEKKCCRLAYLATGMFVTMFFLDNFLIRMIVFGSTISIFAVFFYMGIFVIGTIRGDILKINNTNIDNDVINELIERYGEEFTTAFLYSEGNYVDLKKIDQKFSDLMK